MNKRNSEVAVMDKRVNELRDRLWKKKAALQQKENLPVSGLFDSGGGGVVGEGQDRGLGRREKDESPARSVFLNSFFRIIM